MLIDALPSASATSATTPGRFGTETRSSVDLAAGQLALEQAAAVGAGVVVPGGDRVRVARLERGAHGRPAARVASSIAAIRASALAR